MFELVEAKPNIFYFMCIFYYKIYNTCDLRFEKNASILFILFIDFFFFSAGCVRDSNAHKCCEERQTTP